MRELDRDDYAKLKLVRLEDRLLLDVAGLVSDINPGKPISSPEGFTEFHGDLYFSATRDGVGRELFKVDGRGNVSLVEDINQEDGDSDPEGFTRFNNRLYFTAKSEELADRQIFVLDSSETVRTIDSTDLGLDISNPSGFTAFDDQLYFAAELPGFGGELLRMDENEFVSLVEDIKPGDPGSNPRELTELNGQLFFVAELPDTGQGLFVLTIGDDGQSIRQIEHNSPEPSPSGLTVFNGSLYYAANTDGNRFLVRYSPDEGQPVRLSDVTNSFVTPTGMMPFNGKLYFKAIVPFNGRELVWVDTNDQVQLATNIRPGTDSASPETLTVFNEKLYFVASGDNGMELFRVDTNDNLLGFDINPNGDSAPTELTVFNSQLYFQATGSLGSELYRLDQTETVMLVSDINPTGDSRPSGFTTFHGDLYFQAFEREFGTELYQLSKESSLDIVGSRLVLSSEGSGKDNRILVSNDGFALTVRDENGHRFSTGISGAEGNGTDEVVIPLASLSGVTQFDVDLASGVDSVTVDLSSNAATFLSAFDRVNYDGGPHPVGSIRDRMRLRGDGLTDADYRPNTRSEGVGTVTVTQIGQSTSFRFYNTEAIDIAEMKEARLTGSTDAGSNRWEIASGKDNLDNVIDALLVTGGDAVGDQTRASFFGNQSLILDTTAGSNDSDTIVFRDAANGHGNSDIVVHTRSVTGGDNDQVSFEGRTTLSRGLEVVTSQVQLDGSLALDGDANIVANRVVFGANGALTAPGEGSIEILAERRRPTDGNVLMTRQSRIDGGTGSVHLIADDDIQLGQVVTQSTARSAVTIHSRGGGIFDAREEGHDGPNVEATAVGAGVVFVAAESIGDGNGGGAVDLNVRKLKTTTHHGDQFLSQGNDLESIEMVARSGAVNLQVVGDLGDEDEDLDLVATSAFLNVTGNFGDKLARIETQVENLRIDTSAEDGDQFLRQFGDLGSVSLAAGNGSIRLNIFGRVNDTDSEVDISAREIEVMASMGFGSSSNNQTIQTAVGNVEIHGGIGEVHVRNLGNLRLGNVTGTNVGVRARGRIDIETIGALAIDEPVQSETSSIRLDASSEIEIDSTIASPLGPVSIASSGGAIAMHADSTVDGGNGPVELTALGDVFVSRLTTDTIVQINSLAGSVLDLPESNNASIESHGAVLAASKDIGTAINPLDVAISHLEIPDGDSNVVLDNIGELTIGGVTGANEGINANGVTLTATGSVTVKERIHADFTGVHIESFDGLQVNSDIVSADGELKLVSRHQFVEMGRGAVVDGGLGSVLIKAVDDVVISRIQTRNTVSVISTAGAIVEVSGLGMHGIDASGAILRAFNGAGTLADPISVGLDNLEAVSDAGGVHVIDMDNLTIGGVSADADGVVALGDIQLASAQDLIVNESVVGRQESSVSLHAGNDLQNNGMISSQHGNLALSAVNNLVGATTSVIHSETGDIRLASDADGNRMGTLKVAGELNIGVGTLSFILTDDHGLVSAVIGGQGGVEKLGAGRLRIVSQNAYTGTTSVGDGQFVVDGSIGPANTVFLAAGTTFSGSGNVDAPILSSDANTRIVSSGNLRLGDGTNDGFDFAGEMIVASGHSVTLRDGNLALLGRQTTVSENGILLAANGVEVGFNERLLGDGRITGRIEALRGGTVAPGLGTGRLETRQSDLHLLPGSNLDVEINGTSPGATFDQLSINGNVILDGANLNLRGGLFLPRVGTQFSLVINDSSEPVSGLFVGPDGRQIPEGGTIKFGGVTTSLSYVGGEGGNDIVLTVVNADIVFTPQEIGESSVIFFAPEIDHVDWIEPSPSEPVVFIEPVKRSSDLEWVESRRAHHEEQEQSEFRLFFRVVDEVTGEDTEGEYDLDPNWLNNLPGIFQRFTFPNGHYRIYMQEAGATRVRKLLDVHVYEGKVVPENFRETLGSDSQFESKTTEAPSQPADQIDRESVDADEESRPEEGDSSPSSDSSESESSEHVEARDVSMEESDPESHDDSNALEPSSWNLLIPPRAMVALATACCVATREAGQGRASLETDIRKNWLAKNSRLLRRLRGF